MNPLGYLFRMHLDFGYCIDFTGNKLFDIELNMLQIILSLSLSLPPNLSHTKLTTLIKTNQFGYNSLTDRSFQTLKCLKFC